MNNKKARYGSTQSIKSILKSTAADTSVKRFDVDQFR